MNLHSNSSSTSKAANFWNLLHTEHEFSAEYLKAVLANDEKAVANALGKIGKSPNEVNLSKEEFVAFMRGRTPSGGLEITSFEGYYETESFSGQVFAVLILSVSNRIFWGPARDFFRHNWSKNEVEYQLGSDATVSFPSSAGNVVLSFSRDFDEKEGTVGNGSFTVGPFGYLQWTDCLTTSNRVLSKISRSPDLKQSLQTWTTKVSRLLPPVT